MTNYAKASVHPSELREFQDDQTGAHIYQLTNDTSINHNLYFLTSSFTPDQEHLIFTSYRSGKPNFFKLGFPNGDIVQLTDAEDIHGYSGVISKNGTELFYTQADSIKAIHLGTFEERVLAEFPGGGLGECSVSADERFIVTAMKRDDKSHITVTATDGSGGEVIHTSPDQTIIHPQFHPRHPDLIAYSGDPAPRMWTIKRDGTENRSLYQHDNNEFLVHETFLGALDALIVTHWHILASADVSGHPPNADDCRFQRVAHRQQSRWHERSCAIPSIPTSVCDSLMWRQVNIRRSVIRRKFIQREPMENGSVCPRRRLGSCTTGR